MTQHYYTENPQSAHDVRLHQASVAGLTMKFYTDSGVFSKTGLDDGTRLLIETAPALEGRVLDMGCGWGALGLTLAKLNPAARFVLTDVNSRATHLAQKNARENGLTGVEILTGDGFQKIEGTFDYVFTNPPIRAGKQVIYGWFEESIRRLNPGGELYLVIRKQQGAPSAQKFLLTLTPNVDIMARDKGYWILRAVKEKEA